MSVVLRPVYTKRKRTQGDVCLEGVYTDRKQTQIQRQRSQKFSLLLFKKNSKSSFRLRSKEAPRTQIFIISKGFPENVETVEDLTGAGDARPRVQILLFSCCFRKKNWSNDRLAPLRVDAPFLSGKLWIQHCETLCWVEGEVSGHFLLDPLLA